VKRKDYNCGGEKLVRRDEEEGKKKWLVMMFGMGPPTH